MLNWDLRFLPLTDEFGHYVNFDEDEQICHMGCLADADNQFLCLAATILFFLCGAEF